MHLQHCYKYLTLKVPLFIIYFVSHKKCNKKLGYWEFDNCLFVIMCFNIFLSDFIPPTITGCPNDIFESVDVNLSGAIVQYTPPVAQDNSGTATLVSTPQPSGTFFPIGKTTITFTYRDPSGNEAVCTFCITVSAGKYRVKFAKDATHTR